MRATASASHARRSSGARVPSEGPASGASALVRRVRSTSLASSFGTIATSTTVLPVTSSARAAELPAASTAMPLPRARPLRSAVTATVRVPSSSRAAPPERRRRSCARTGPTNATSQAPRASERATRAASTPEASGSEGVPVRSSARTGLHAVPRRAARGGPRRRGRRPPSGRVSRRVGSPRRRARAAQVVGLASIRVMLAKFPVGWKPTLPK